MAKAWMPGAERIDGGTTRTAGGVGAPRAVWTVTGTDPNMWSAREEATRLVHEGRTPHLVWNPLTGAVAQILAATRRSELLLGHTSRYGQHLDHGDEGRVCLMIAVVSTEKEPFTDGPLVGLAPVLEWLGSWGVERGWPAGPPGLWGERRPSEEEQSRTWSRGGHFGHDQVPGSASTAPGRVDPEQLLIAGTREVSPVPAPAPGPRSGSVPEAAATARPPQLPREHPEPQPSVIT
ncbi:hypothetical protein [Nocardiopsis valliformis]|uniref:hypothetical protein n=1 Tax=Nocardiopsis valliformis TaxID=239974 RepID=UPI00034AA95C|nr:hypothetical protein [Nocardiopsis valliformis]